MRILLFMNKEMIRPVIADGTGEAQEAYLKQGGNSGNCVFFHAVYQYVNTKYNTVAFLDFDRNNQILNYSSDEINEKFDVMVIPSVIFEINSASKRAIRAMIYSIKGIRIPIVCLGVGTQIEKLEDKKRLEDFSKDDIRDFSECIEKSGGGLALRGYFTKEIFDDLGIRNAAVTGCPSFFQNGKNGMHVSGKMDTREKFTPVLNGFSSTLQTRAVREFLHEYKNSVYIDQGLFLSEFYGEKNGTDFLRGGVFCLLKDWKRYSGTGLNLLKSGRVRLFFDYETWRDYLKKFSFSLGERIHGNIIAVLAGVPAFVCYHDSRTREMAEYFNIPCADRSILNRRFDLYRLYADADYQKMENGYDEKFLKFESFLQQYGIVKDLSHLSQ